MDLLSLLMEAALRLCFVVACFYFARLKGRHAWLWCPLGYVFSIFALLPLCYCHLPKQRNARKTLQTTINWKPTLPKQRICLAANPSVMRQVGTSGPSVLMWNGS